MLPIFTWRTFSSHKLSVLTYGVMRTIAIHQNLVTAWLLWHFKRHRRVPFEFRTYMFLLQGSSFGGKRVSVCVCVCLHAALWAVVPVRWAASEYVTFVHIEFLALTMKCQGRRIRASEEITITAGAIFTGLLSISCWLLPNKQMNLESSPTLLFGCALVR